jgi:hypothetical protein
LSPVVGRPTGPIVWDLLETVNQHRAWGVNLPVWKPEVCSACDREGTLVGHGLRERKRAGVWVRRVRCGRHGRPRDKACGRGFTLLPSTLYPHRHYSLEQLQTVLLGRFAQTPARTWRELGLVAPAADTTMSLWCEAFSACASFWSSALSTTFAHLRDQFALTRSMTGTVEHTVLSLGALVLDWREKTATGKALDESQLLQRLWGWGSCHVRQPLLSSTLFAKGRRRGRRLNRGPPD